MEEPNYSYMEIDTGDIWNYERSFVVSGNADLELARKVLDKIESLIIREGKPSFTVDLYDNGTAENRKYYERKVKECRESITSVEQLFRNEIFFHRNDCYSFEFPVVVNPEHEEFEFMFALKLRQYDARISAIAEFLEHQLEKNFNSEAARFVRFLKLCLRQYTGILSEKVIVTTNEWIQEKGEAGSSEIVQKTAVDSSQLREEITAVKINAPVLNFGTPLPASFTLKAYVEDPEYFVKNANEFVEVFQALKKGFFSSETKLDQFRAILSNKNIKREDRIEWTGSLMELSMFVRLLHNDLEKILPIEKGVWSIAVSCFTKEGKNIKESQLSNASGSTRNRELLSTLLQRL